MNNCLVVVHEHDVLDKKTLSFIELLKQCFPEYGTYTTPKDESQISINSSGSCLPDNKSCSHYYVGANAIPGGCIYSRIWKFSTESDIFLVEEGLFPQGGQLKALFQNLTDEGYPAEYISIEKVIGQLCFFEQKKGGFLNN